MGAEAPPGLWADTAPPGPACPPLDGDAACEVAVVGAGFSCLSAAQHRLERRRGRWRLSPASGSVSARALVLAGNGYSDGLRPGLAHNVVPVKSVIVPIAGHGLRRLAVATRVAAGRLLDSVEIRDRA